MAEKIGSIYFDLDLDDKKYKEGISSSLNEAKKAEKSIKGNLDNVSKHMTDMGSVLTKLSLPLIGLAVGIGKVTKEFDEIFTGTSAIAKASGATAQEINQLKDIILEFSGKGVFGIKEVAMAVDDMVKDGLNPATISMYQLNAVYSLASASGESMAQSQVALSDVMQGFGADTSEAMAYADAFANFLNATPGSLTDFQEAMQPVGPLAVSMGVNVKDLSTTLAILANNGIRGSEAGNGLKRVLLNLINPSTDMMEAMNMINLEVYDSQGNFRGLRTVLNDIIEGTKNLTQEQKNYILSTIGGAYGQASLNTIVNNGIDAFDEFSIIMEKTGTAQQIADDRTQGFTASLKKLGASIQASLIKVGLDKSFSGLIEKLSLKLIPLIEKAGTWFVNLSDKMKLIVMVGGAIFIALGPFLLIVGQIIGAVSTFIPVITAIGGAIGSVTLPMLVIIGVIVALIAGIVFLQIKFNVLGKAFEAIKKIIEKLMPFFKEMYQILSNNLKESLEQMQPSIDQIKESFVKLQPLLPVLKESFEALAIVIGTVIATTIGIIFGLINAVITVLPYIIQQFSNFFSLFSNIVQLVKNVLTGNWSEAWENVKAIVGNIVNIIITQFEIILAFIWGFVEGIISFFHNLYMTLVGGSIIPDMVRAIILWINNMVNTVLNFITNLVNRIIAFFISLYVNVFTAIRVMISGVFALYDQLVNGIIQRISTIKDRIISVLSGVESAISQPFQNAVNKVKGIVDSAKDALDKLNPFHRESPSLVDWITKGTGVIVDQYDNMFNKLGNMTAQGRIGLTATAQTLTQAVETAPSGSLAGIGNITIPVENYYGDQVGLTNFAEKIIDEMSKINKSRG